MIASEPRVTKKLIGMREALEDPAILGAAMGGSTWLAWRALLIAALGEALTAEERRAFEELTLRAQEPLEVVEEFVVVVGRRGGKTLAGAVLLVYLACLVDYSNVLNIGERGVALFIAQNQKQASVAFNYAAGIIKSSPMLRKMVVNETGESIELNNGVSIEVRPSSFRGLRGVTAVGILADEAAFYYAEGANADTEILNAIRPSLATTGGMLAIFSSPYAQKGEVWTLYDQNFKPDGDPRILVAQGASRDLNPSLSQRVVDRALERDAVAASAEYLAKFRQDVTGFISRELLLAAVDAGVTERPTTAGIEYVAFCDAASGIASSGDGDRFAVCVGHLEHETVVIDLVRRWMPPFNASAVTAEVASIAQAYRCAEVISDGFSSGFLRSELTRHGVGHRITEFSKAELYLASLPMLTSGKVRLPDVQFIVDEFASLERRPGTAGHDKVDARGHEDGANVCAGVIAQFSAAEPFTGWGLLEHYKRMSEAASSSATPTLQQEHAYQPLLQGIAPKRAADAVRLVTPAGLDFTNLFGASGLSYLAEIEGADRVFYVSRADAAALLSNPISNLNWIETNAQLAAELRRGRPKQPTGIRISDILQAAADARPKTIVEVAAVQGTYVNETLRALGRRA